MVALMLQVRPCLTWRDVQHIIAFTATKYEDRRADWELNGAGFHHSHQHGFGLLNAWRLVNAAKVWESVPYLTSYQSPVFKEERVIPSAPAQLRVSWDVTAEDLGQSGMRTLEHVAVTLTLTHPRRGNVEIVLLCPSGISSLIGARRAMDSDPSGFSDWMFSTVRCWGERAEGVYTLLVQDHADGPLTQGTLNRWQLTLYGSSWSSEEVKERQQYETLVEHAMGGQYLVSSFSLPCPPGLEIQEPPVTTLTANSLKSLLLLGCFALFWSLYYTLETLLAHLDWRALCRGAPCRAGRDRQVEEGGGEGEGEGEGGRDPMVPLERLPPPRQFSSHSKTPVLQQEEEAAPLISPTDPSGFSDWMFSTVRCWGERAEGVYTLLVQDHADGPLTQGTLNRWQLTLYGSSWSSEEVKERQQYETLVEHAMGGQYLVSSFSLPCPPGLEIQEPPVTTLTANSLKTDPPYYNPSAIYRLIPPYYNPSAIHRLILKLPESCVVLRRCSSWAAARLIPPYNPSAIYRLIPPYNPSAIYRLIPPPECLEATGEWNRGQ
ncbi:UNVERIFIED_CONTAM: hypothetical protein FKN15_020697 [Acipenser sinensis]